MSHISDKKENQYVIKKKVNKKNKNREVCEGQPGVLAFATQADRRFDRHETYSPLMD